ncbi:MAG TPA: ATP-binding cassette domain-containing protein, partial [Asticcacaulis sp.]|nr:ATP-binding cassette domain-containing protein [Asticcacaulis sp.]
MKRKVLAPLSDENVDPIVITGLNNSFGTNVVHENLDLTVKRGEILGIVGGSGSGKTVLLRSILGLQKPTSGDIHIFGHRLYEGNETTTRQIQAKTGVLFQSGALFSTLTVAENIMAPMMEFTRLSRREARAVALLKMSMAGLPLTAADLAPSELSGGMIKRAALARALALDPEIVFLDEPTSGLDPLVQQAFYELMREAREDGRTVFLSSHILAEVERTCDRVAIIRDGRLVKVDRTEALRDLAHHQVELRFAGDVPVGAFAALPGVS